VQLARVVTTHLPQLHAVHVVLDITLLMEFVKFVHPVLSQGELLALVLLVERVNNQLVILHQEQLLVLLVFLVLILQMDIVSLAQMEL
jgi:hypothetical protein